MIETLVSVAALVVIAAALAAVWVGVAMVRSMRARRQQEVIDEETARERARPHGHAAIGELDAEAAPPHQPKKAAPRPSLRSMSPSELRMVSGPGALGLSAQSPSERLERVLGRCVPAPISLCSRIELD